MKLEAEIALLVFSGLENSRLKRIIESQEEQIDAILDELEEYEEEIEHKEKEIEYFKSVINRQDKLIGKLYLKINENY